ncbi:Uncharacterised protein [Candidatus Anstonella stagnisolia]|nr:Uncharacterised protein [Candidatus Anstonella stagnisolia]
MSNAINNAVGLGVLFFLIIAFGIAVYIADRIAAEAYGVVNNAVPNSLTDKSYLDWLTVRLVLIQGFYVLVSWMVFLTFVSSWIDGQSFLEYIASAIGALIVTPVVIFIITSVWNGIVVLGFSFSEINLVFINNWPGIMLANLLFGLAAFVFRRRQVQ